MRCFMRQPRFATKAFQLAAVPIVAAFVCCSPAFAHSHGHVRGHAYRVQMQTNNFASATSFDTTSSMAAAQASAAGIPVSLVERVIGRESGGNVRAVHAGNYGLMQI